MKLVITAFRRCLIGPLPHCLILISLPLFAASSGQPSGQEPPLASERGRLETWLAAVDRHAPGVGDQWAASLGVWTARDLNAALGHAVRVGGPLLEQRLKRAAMLHADIAMLHRTSAGYGRAGTGTTVAGFADGETSGAIGRTAHWAFARRVLDEFVAERDRRRLREAGAGARLDRLPPPPDDDRRRWYRATSAFLQMWKEYFELVPHLDHARAAFPDDPVLLLIEGSMHEAFAEPQIQLALESQRRNRQDLSAVGTVPYERRAALQAFEAALRADPQLFEARIRRANVLHRAGRHPESVEEVRRALSPAMPPTLRYWARLVEGRSLLAQDKPEEARVSFAAALEVFPLAQTPRLGLTQSGMRLGEAPDPAALVLREGSGSDPWLVYHQSHVPNNAAMLNDLWQRWPR